MKKYSRVNETVDEEQKAKALYVPSKIKSLYDVGTQKTCLKFHHISQVRQQAHVEHLAGQQDNQDTSQLKAELAVRH